MFNRVLKMPMGDVILFAFLNKSMMLLDVVNLTISYKKI